MNLNPSQLMHKGLLFVGKHSPVILTAVGSGCVVLTAVFAVNATPKAIAILEARKQEEGKEKDIPPEEVELTVWDKTKACWKVYLPMVLAGGTAIACMVGSTKISLGRIESLAGLYSLTERAFSQYKEKVAETLGEKDRRKVEAAVNKDILERHPVSNSTVIVTGVGDYLCFDKLSGRYFMSDIEKLRRVQNDCNQNLIQNMYISLNEVYDAMGLMPIDMGYDVGWDVDNMVDLSFTTQLSDDGRPCLVVDYLVQPKHDFSKLF